MMLTGTEFENAARNADEEKRWKVVGLIDDRLFTVVFTMRDGICRLISARRSNVKEKRTYGTPAV
ncbi:BrnT family toxin [Lichenifustis flavocetrariae]|uniref:BrnT family toxin n=1 Tax=Lichenifustis flavocetrariae TaxID=2949735 RepID=UPI003D0A5BEC